jgi:hypothetical protein
MEEVVTDGFRNALGVERFRKRIRTVNRSPHESKARHVQALRSLGEAAVFMYV